CADGSGLPWSPQVNDCAVRPIWWRPERSAATGMIADSPGSRAAFKALVAFTVILLLTPQTVFPALKTLRIALVTSGLAIALHAFDSTLRRRPILSASPEVVTVLALLLWTMLTIPFSYWPGGSVALLSDQYVKAIVFFWLIAALVTTRGRLRAFSWAL